MTGGNPPRFDCPLPARLSPHADQAREWLADWLSRFDLPLDPATGNRLRHADVARYAARVHPDAGPADLRTLSALFTWFFLVDDACDHPHRIRPAEIRALRAGVLHLLRHGPDAHHPGFTGPLRRIFVDAFREPWERMPARWRLRFADAVAHHLDGVWREATNRAAGRVPTVAEYVPLRRATSAAEVSYALIEFTTGRPLPDAVYHHPLLRRVADTGNDLLSWFNDVVSLDRDLVGSGGHNLVLAVARESDLPLETAVARVAERWAVTMREFTALRAAVPSFGHGLDDAVTAHVDGIAHTVRGTLDWTRESARYALTG